MEKEVLPQQQVDAVISTLSSGEFQEALEKTTILSQKYPDEPLLFNISGACYQGLRQFETAATYYEKAIEIKPDYYKAHFNLGGVLQEQGKLKVSIDSFEKALSIKPDYAEAYNNIGSVFKELDQSDNAIRSFEKAIEIKPDYFEAYYNLGQTFQGLNNIDAAIKSYEEVLIIKPDFAELHNNLGVIYHGIDKIDSARKHLKDAVRIMPEFVEAYNNLGNVYKLINKPDKAIACYQKTIAINPGLADGYFNIGVVLQEQKKIKSAISNYETAISLNPNYADAYMNLAHIMQDLMQFDEAVEIYQKVLMITKDNAEALTELGITYMHLGKSNASIESFKKALAIDSNLNLAHNGLGIVFHKINQLEKALISYEKAIFNNPEYAEAYLNLGNLMTDLDQLDKAVLNYQYAFDLNPEIDNIFGNLLHIKMHLCIWDDFYNDLEELIKKINNNERVITPFPLLALIDDPKIQRKNAEMYVNDKYPRNHNLPKLSHYSKHAKIRIGYFSADFREHPVSTLTAELYEIHDRGQFEIYAFSFGPDTQDAMNLRIKAGVDHFHNVHEMSDKDIAILSRSLEIDIAIDLGGHTKSARTGIFAMSAAPIQVHYLGYLGTMGTDYYDYLLADQTLIPMQYQQYYSEKIAYLPSYQVNDSTELTPKIIFTREDLGLPKEGFVFCCFNNTYKFTPSTFDSWAKILKQVKGSVLFLLVDTDIAKINLRKEIIQRGIDPKRLFFGERLARPEYLARYRTVDLFLDTHPCNAGITASDALKMGLPLITYKGESYQARIGASILNSINLPELITSSPEEYESLAIELATHPEKLKVIKDKLESNLSKAPLCNTRLITSDLESAFTMMYERYLKGLEVDHIYVKH